MPTTSRGYTYPDSSGHARLWEHLQTLAEDISDDVDLVAADTTLDSDTISADSSTFTSESAALMSVTGSLVNGRRYRVQFCLNAASTVANDVAGFRIREDNTGGNQLVLAPVYIPTTTANGWAVSFFVDYVASSTASKTFVVTGQRLSGTGSVRVAASTSRLASMALTRA
jgi:hypothetical protein